MAPKDWTDKMKKTGAAAQFLQPYGDNPDSEENKKEESEEGQDFLDKQGGRGAKSRIANDALRKYFLDKGLL